MIPAKELHNYLGKEIISKQGNTETVLVFNEIKSCWLIGVNKTNNSHISILIGAKEDEHAPKYYLK